MNQRLYQKDYSRQSEEEWEKFLMEEPLLERLKKIRPEWGEPLENLERGIQEEGDFSWEEGTSDVMRFALILSKCNLITQALGGKIYSATGPFPGEASIYMDLPTFALIRDVDENLLRYLGRYAHAFSAYPNGKGVRVTIGLPYPEEERESNIIRLY